MELDGVVFYGRLGHLALQMYGLDGELQRWRGCFAARRYDQGFSGFTDGLQLWRS